MLQTNGASRGALEQHMLEHSRVMPCEISRDEAEGELYTPRSRFFHPTIIAKRVEKHELRIYAHILIPNLLRHPLVRITSTC